MTEADSLPKAMIGAGGMAAYAVAMSALSRLERKGVLAAGEIVGIIEDALSGIENVHAAKPSVELHVARELLETSLSEWQAKASAEPSAK